MSNSRRKRIDPRREQTRMALVEAAESLFAENGIESVSVRQIGAAIGSANNAVISYHFGSKEDLIVEIYRYRLRDIEARRAELFRLADENGMGNDLEAMLRALWVPLFEQQDDNGRHSYARFLLAMMRKGLGRTRHMVTEDFPMAITIVKRIETLLPFRAGAAWELRWLLATTLILDAIRHIDELATQDEAEAEQLFEEALSMAKAGLLAQSPQSSPG